MTTIINVLLLDMAHTLEIDYLGARHAKIKFIGVCKLKYLEKKLQSAGYALDVLNFNSNGTEVTADILARPWGLPFYETLNQHSKKQGI